MMVLKRRPRPVESLRLPNGAFIAVLMAATVTNDEWCLIMEINPAFVSSSPRQISDIVIGQEDNITAREALLRWARKSTARYPGVRINDFTASWRDGLGFSAILHRNRPDLIDWRDVRQRRVRERLETAFHILDKEYGVTRLLDVAG